MNKELHDPQCCRGDTHSFDTMFHSLCLVRPVSNRLTLWLMPVCTAKWKTVFNYYLMLREEKSQHKFGDKRGSNILTILASLVVLGKIKGTLFFSLFFCFKPNRTPRSSLQCVRVCVYVLGDSAIYNKYIQEIKAQAGNNHTDTNRLPFRFLKDN